MFFYRNPLKWVNSLEISASSAWDPAGFMFGEVLAVSENQEIVVANAGFLSGDGKNSFVSVLQKDEDGIYEHIQTIRVIGLGIAGSDSFGTTLLVSKDGSTIVAGAREPEPDWSSWQSESAEDYGVIVILQSGSSGWTQTQTIVPQEELPYMNYFSSLQISDDGSRLIAHNRPISGDAKGSLLVYEKNTSGSFELQQEIVPPAGNSMVSFDTFLESNLSADKTTLFVGHETISGSIENQGAVYIYNSGSNGYELSEIITDENEVRLGAWGGMQYLPQKNLLALRKSGADWSGGAVIYQSGSSGFQKVQTIEGSAEETLKTFQLSEDGTTLLTTIKKDINNPKNKMTIRFYQSGSTGFQPTGVELETDDTYTNWDWLASSDYRFDYNKSAGRIVASAYGYDVAGVGSQVGAIYVFDSGSNGWQQSQLITASDDWNPYADVFGYDFQLANSNEILAIHQFDSQDIVWRDGANYWEQFNADSVGGSLYIYRKQGEEYEQVQRIQNPSPGMADYFGAPFAIADSGNKLVIAANAAIQDIYTGSANDPLDLDLSFKGKVFVYGSGSNGYTLVQEIKKDAPNQFFSFGSDVALNSSGQNLFISAHDGSTGGSVYVYESGSSGYTQVQELTSSVAVPYSYDYFTSIELSKDEQILLVCELFGDTDTHQNAGSLTIFVSGSEGYEEVQRLTPDDTIDPDGWGQFGQGNGMFISEDNQTIAIGSRLEQVALDQSVARSGAVRIYQSGSSGYEQVQLITAPAEDPVNGYEFGVAVDISGSYLAIGSPADAHDESSGTSFSAPDRGSVWIYEKINGVYEKKYRIARESGSNAQSVGTWNGQSGFRTGFGNKVKFLPNNEILIASPFDDKNGADSGVVYRYKLTRDY